MNLITKFKISYYIILNDVILPKPL